MGTTSKQGLGDVASSCVNEKVETIPDEQLPVLLYGAGDWWTRCRVRRVVDGTASDGDVSK